VKLVEKREFTVATAYSYDCRGPARWIASHLLRYPWLPGAGLLTAVMVSFFGSESSVMVGRAFDLVMQPGGMVSAVLRMALTIGALAVGQGLALLLRNLAMETLAQRIERDSRDELYLSLLGKSLTFHGRQRIGDIMARATDDVHMLNFMVSPGLTLILASAIGLVVPILAIAANLPWQLLLAPSLFVIGFAVTLRRYMAELEPVADAVREQFGVLNARLAETVAGIEVVKGSAQEVQERRLFYANARRFRDLYVQQGEVQARYLPILVLTASIGIGLLHALLLWRDGALTIGRVIAYMGLLRLLEFPSFISIWSFALVQLGVASARRILELISTETELDENLHGVEKPMRGEIDFERVCFGYDGNLVLKDISFRAKPGETLAIVGETGSGKTTLTRLVNRIYDATGGRVLVDGVDVRDWNLASLRSQISAIEQDIFLFSRSLEDNIAFGAEHEVAFDQIRHAAREAQADGFISGFPEGYETEIGERGVALSGGQRQRVAIARAFLTDPRILILDDSTSAIDSATEDEIQRAMRRIMRGRTTLLITHRLSQIRWADRVLVLRRGELVDQGAHDELMSRCEAYRRIFSHYEPARRPTAPVTKDT
jgi:ATP-binding cassette subfamily B protein